MDSAIILLQLVGAIVIVLLAWAFLSGLVEEHSFKGAFSEVVEMLKVIPFLLIYFLVIDFAIGGLFYLIGSLAGA